MSQNTGITIEKDLHGNARYAHIDLRKHGKQLNSFLKKQGIDLTIRQSEDKVNNPADCVPLKEGFDEVRVFVNELYNGSIS